MPDSHLPPEVSSDAAAPEGTPPQVAEEAMAPSQAGNEGAVGDTASVVGVEAGQAAVSPQAGEGLPAVHLRSAEEAEEIRRKTLRNERLSAVMIAVLVHVLIGLGLALWALDVFEAPEVKIQARVAPPTENSSNRPQVQQPSQRRPPSAPSVSAKMITSTAESVTYVPDVVFESPTLDIGTSAQLGLGFGQTGLGDGLGQGGFGGLGGGMKGRCTMEERMKRLNEAGGNRECEEAVVKSLEWFKKVQNSDGSFGKARPAAMTGLVLLSYLGHCETPQSSKYGETVSSATAYLVERSQRDKGYLRSEKKTDAWVYEHVIALYALGECLAFVRELNMEIPGLQDAVERGTDILIAGQHRSGGWDYQLNRSGGRGGDTSITGWALQALKAVKTAGYGEDFGDSIKLSKSVRKGLGYIEDMQMNDGYLSYKKKGDRRGSRWSLNGLGSLSFQIHGKKGRVVSRGIDATKKVPVKYNQKTAHLYGWYYITQSRFLSGGSDWERWNRKWRDELLKNQLSDGRWKVEGGGKKFSVTESRAGRDAQIYRNALCTLMLEVYYRFLPGTSGE
ncbi:terpene cyclase/mutase family protein [Sulfuriroseicoccus oceanibius]|uniref:Terpene cyclase/mutase family protein n=1 Tax=Sulfuriroseicoccus oceanibius TaxID=2707525 RepID=A0A6B3L6W8_9BACT|nr:terpene cyclase/mutase family protein [Sulfuriroseicoccus oceanibius]QQL45095.1 terpene cyclase/mutase family protein [Sulfuriroseicoccus oceanibius]